GLVALLAWFLGELGIDLFFGSISDSIKGFARQYLQEGPAMNAAEIIRYTITFVVLLAFSLLSYWVGQQQKVVLASKGEKKSIPKASIYNGELFPDWTIRELFLHIDPYLLDAGEARWRTVNSAVRDCLCVGKLRSWGRNTARQKLGEDAPLEEIDKDYWRTASLTLNFFLYGKNHRGLVHAMADTDGPQYRDVQVNQSQALGIWSEPIAFERRPFRDLLRKATERGWCFLGESH
ncbi:MAG: hypothetical protein HY765_04340, partial [Rhodomicrobium sp.]|nr:hypothetical protein [Rhodomicrobium sp.]